MKLLIDIGNTRVKWALDSGAGLDQPGDLVHSGQEPEALAKELVGQLQVAPDSAWAVNVAGDALALSLGNELQDRFGVRLQNIGTSDRCGDVVNGYRSIDQLGVDRWAAIVGAWHSNRQSLCVVDAGTAVTIDLISATGQHRGGIIVPGLGLMQGSLDMATSDIRDFSQRSAGPLLDGDWLGKDTLSAVQRGAIFMLVAAIEKVLDSADSPLLVLTGGDAALIADNLEVEADLRPQLVLEGLRLLAMETEHA